MRILGFWLLGLFSLSVFAQNLPDNFVYLEDIDPSIIQEMRYAQNHNFVGKPLKGYLKASCILTKPTAEALKKVQTELKGYGYSLKVYDCYRPQMAVDEFIEWSKNPKDQLMKKEFYPKVNKKNVFKLGYVADKSGHTRGSTVDLTIVKKSELKQAEYHPGQKLTACYASYEQRFHDNSIDMGTGFDCFDKRAHLKTNKITDFAQKNRHLLQHLMVRNGFKPYPYEWWHFTLMDEPYPNTYFNFPVE